MRPLFFLLLSFFNISINAMHTIISPSLLVNALIIGRDNSNQPIFLCRTSLFGETQVGTLMVKSQSCIFTHQGKVYSVKEFTIPNKKEFGLYTWSKNDEYALAVGVTTGGKSLFICQSNFNGMLLVGKTWSGYPHCNVLYKGNELITDITYILSSLR